MSQVWLITGSSRGLGRAVAEAALAAGHQVAATARTPAQLQDLVARFGDQVRAVALDVTDQAQCHAAIAATVAAFGRLDVLVNNAGYANINSIEDMAPDDFRAQFETDFFGVVNMTRAALPVMRGQGSGHIIQVSSIGGRQAGVGLSAYQSAKWAVGGFSEALSKEAGPLGIRVTVVEPGGMRTDWGGSSMQIADITEPYRATVGRRVTALREGHDSERGDPAKVAVVILAIAADPAPPLRLLLGSDAVLLAEHAARTRAAEDAKWRALSLSTDFDGLGDFADTPIAKVLMRGEG